MCNNIYYLFTVVMRAIATYSHVEFLVDVLTGLEFLHFHPHENLESVEGAMILHEGEKNASGVNPRVPGGPNPVKCCSWTANQPISGATLEHIATVLLLVIPHYLGGQFPEHLRHLHMPQCWHRRRP